MKGVQFLGNRVSVVKDFDDPLVGPRQVRVRMKVSSICGSDMHTYRRLPDQLGEQAKLIPGHEACGVVDEIGSCVKNVSIGDRVLVDMSMGCGYCSHCLSGDDHYCENAHSLGLRWNGSWADYLLAEDRACLKMPEDISFEEGAILACAGGTAFSATRKLKVSGCDTVVIFGLGPVGLVGVMMAKAMGARVIGIDLIEERLKMASTFGADALVDASKEDTIMTILKLTGGKGAEVALDYSGSSKAQSQCLDAVQNYGRIAWIGVNEQPVLVDSVKIIVKQLHLFGSLTYKPSDVADLFDFVRFHKLPLQSLITHRFKIEQAVEALRLFDTGRTGKILFVWD